MAFNISKTDQVLVLLNRLAVSDNATQQGSTEQEHLLPAKDHCDEGLLNESHFNLDVEGQSSRRWSSTANGSGTRRQSQGNQPAAAVRIVLGDQRNSIGGDRKLRYGLSFLQYHHHPLMRFVCSAADSMQCLQVH